MSHIANIIRKELRELLTLGSVASVLVMVVLFAGLGGLIGGEVEKAQSTPVFGIANASYGVVNLGDGEWSAYDTLVSYYSGTVPSGESIHDYIIDLGDVPSSELMAGVMKDAGITSAIMIDQDFSTDIESKTSGTILEFYFYEPSGMFGSVSSTVLSNIVTLLGNNLSAVLMTNAIDDPAYYPFYAHPVSSGGSNINTVIDGISYPGVTPYEISSEISSKTMMMPMIIMIIIMMVGSIVISSMGSEKENKTLETLLTLPIKRTTIVTGKLIAAAIVGLVYGLAYMAGMSIYMGAMMNPLSSGVDLNSVGMGLGMTDYLLIMASMFLAILCALGICMILGAFAKNYKSAQTMTMPLSILAMIPMFITMFSGWYSSGPALQALLFAIPFSHPMMAMQSLMYGDVTLVLMGIGYMAVFAIATIIVTVRLYASDILVTGIGQNKMIQQITKKK